MSETKEVWIYYTDKIQRRKKIVVPANAGKLEAEADFWVNRNGDEDDLDEAMHWGLEVDLVEDV